MARWDICVKEKKIEKIQKSNIKGYNKFTTVEIRGFIILDYNMLCYVCHLIVLHSAAYDHTVHVSLVYNINS